jgi:hypothetical protein
LPARVLTALFSFGCAEILARPAKELVHQGFATTIG